MPLSASKSPLLKPVSDARAPLTSSGERLHWKLLCSLGFEGSLQYAAPSHECKRTVTMHCREETPAERAHSMFTLLGLRHLVVVNEASHVRGIITRRDLDHAAGHGAWRRNKIATAPERPEPNGVWQGDHWVAGLPPYITVLL